MFKLLGNEKVVELCMKDLILELWFVMGSYRT